MRHFLASTALALSLTMPLYAAGTTDSDTTTMEKATDAVTSTASDAAEAVENTAKDAAAAAESTADTVAESTAEAVDATGDAARTAVDDTAVDSPRAIPMEGYTLVPATEVSAAQLEGARVYDGKNEWIGEVSKIIMDADGTVDTLVVDVGGFLGLGEKPVGLDFEAFDLQKSLEGDEVRASVKATKDELKSMPEYDG